MQLSPKVLFCGTSTQPEVTPENGNCMCDLADAPVALNNINLILEIYKRSHGPESSNLFHYNSIKICKQISTPPQPYQKIADIYFLRCCSLPNFINILSPITIQFVVVFVLYVVLYLLLYCLLCYLVLRPQSWINSTTTTISPKFWWKYGTPSLSHFSHSPVVGVIESVWRLLLKDPTNDLIQIAEARGMLESRFHALSLGQGQAPFATRMLKEGVREVFVVGLCWYTVSSL